MTIRVRSLVLGGAALVAAFFAGVMVVRAVPGGATRDALSFAGTLRQNGQPMMGQQSVTFTFRKFGISQCAPVVMTTPDPATGNFQVEIPIDKCPDALFDGGDVTVDVSVGAAAVALNQSVNPVPYAKYADRAGLPECPDKYTRDLAEPKYVVCKKGADEVVRVGDDWRAFWIDRYEASVWDAADGTGKQYGVTGNDWAVSGPIYAVSKAGVSPSRVVPANRLFESCAASGKDVPTLSQYYRAAVGTPFTVAEGANGGCFVTNMGAAPRLTGTNSACVSRWGAQDMAGNLADSVQDFAVNNGLAIMTSGGGFASGPGVSAFALYGAGWNGQVDIGFRCVLQP